MTAPDLCPLCLEQLPDGYPYDHVAIDYALTGRTRLRGSERAEAIRVGHRRGMTRSQISTRLHCNGEDIIRVLGPSQTHTGLADDIRRLYAEKRSDGHIATALGISRSEVRKNRNGLGLPALYGPRGIRTREEVAA